MARVAAMRTAARDAPGRRARRAACVLAALAALLPVALTACSDGRGDLRLAARTEAERLLSSDASGALHTARAALADLGPDAALELLAARACLALDRRGEALEHAEAGLELAETDSDLEAELDWAKGAALMGRYRELGNADDWRAANSALETATRAGSRRVEAATMLVFLQDMGGFGSAARRERFARLVEELAPDSEAAHQVRAGGDTAPR